MLARLGVRRLLSEGDPQGPVSFVQCPFGFGEFEAEAGGLLARVEGVRGRQ